MPLTPQQFAALEGNIREVWAANMKMKKDYIPLIYNVVKGSMGQYTDYTTGTAGRMQPWTGSVAYDTVGEGYEKQYRAEQFSTGIQVSRNWYEDKEFQRIKSLVNEVSYGVAKTLQYHGADIFNTAFSSVKIGPDSQPLCSASHKSTPDSKVQSNTGTYELNYDNLDIILRLMEDWEDDRGDKMLIQGDMVIASPNQRANCKKLFGSEKEAFTADNTKNIHKDFEYLIHPLLTNNKWFVVNKAAMKGGSGLNWFMRRDPRKLERDGATALGDFNTEMLSWKAVGRWVTGWTNWWWCFGNNI